MPQHEAITWATNRITAWEAHGAPWCLVAPTPHAVTSEMSKCQTHKPQRTVVLSEGRKQHKQAWTIWTHNEDTIKIVDNALHNQALKDGIDHYRELNNVLDSIATQFRYELTSKAWPWEQRTQCPTPHTWLLRVDTTASKDTRSSFFQHPHMATHHGKHHFPSSAWGS